MQQYKITEEKNSHMHLQQRQAAVRLALQQRSGSPPKPSLLEHSGKSSKKAKGAA